MTAAEKRDVTVRSLRDFVWCGTSRGEINRVVARDLLREIDLLRRKVARLEKARGGK